MQTLELSQQAGPDRRLKLEIPVDKAGVEYRVIVTVEETNAREGSSTWPPGYFEQTFGQWIGELESPTRPFPETRESL